MAVEAGTGPGMEHRGSERVPMDIIVHDNRFLELFDPDQDYQRIASGLTLGEGPVWHESIRSLVFNDIPVSKTYVYNQRSGLRLLFDNGAKGVLHATQIGIGPALVFAASVHLLGFLLFLRTPAQAKEPEETTPKEAVHE